MNLNYLFIELGVPIGAPNLKMESDKTSNFISAAGIGAQLIGNVLNAAQAGKNRKQAQQFFDRSLEEQWKSIKEQEWYNSPQNQRDMLTAAGYSPYAYLNSKANGTSSITAGGNAANGVSPFDTSAFQSAAANRVQNKLADSQSKNLDANTNLTNIDSFSRDAKNLAEIKTFLAKAGVDNAAMIGQNLANFRAKSTMDSMIAYDNRQIDLINSQIEQNLANSAFVNSQKLKVDKETEWVDKFGRQQIAESSSRMAVNAAQVNATYEQAKLYNQNLIESQAREQGLRISNEQAKRVNDVIFTQEFYRAAQEETKSRYLYEYGTETPQEVRKDKYGFEFHRKVDHSRDSDVFDEKGRRKSAKY